MTVKYAHVSFAFISKFWDRLRTSIAEIIMLRKVNIYGRQHNRHPIKSLVDAAINKKFNFQKSEIFRHILFLTCFLRSDKIELLPTKLQCFFIIFVAILNLIPLLSDILAIVS